MIYQIYLPNSNDLMSSRQYYSQHSFSNESKILPYIISKNKLPVQLCFGVSQSNEYTSFFRKIGLATVSSNKASSRKLPVDLVINLKQESFSLIKPISILFHEVHIDHYPHKDKLSLREQLVLQNHFRRIQQHSLVAGQFLGLQAQQLDQPIDLWRTIGILHDIDYARAYSDMDQHGFLSEPILFKYKFDEKICNCIKFHNTLAFQNSSDLLEQSVFFSGRFLKQMVHASRVSGRKIQELQLDDYQSAYDVDCRRNEPLTHFEITSSPESFSDFKSWMTQHRFVAEQSPLGMERLFKLAKQAFKLQSSEPSRTSHITEVLTFI